MNVLCEQCDKRAVYSITVRDEMVELATGKTVMQEVEYSFRIMCAECADENGYRPDCEIGCQCGEHG